MNTASKLIVALSLGLTALPSLADITGASVAPANITINADQNNSVNISWNITNSAAGPETVSSAAGTFVNPATGANLGGNPLTLSGSSTGNLSLPETVNLSANMTRQLYLNGDTALGYSRTFTDVNGTSATAMANFTLIANQTFNSLSAMPAALSQPTLQDLPLNISWAVDVGLAANTVSSGQARITDANGATLLNIATPLSASVQQSSTIAESAVIGAQQIESWVRAGINQVRYTRTFADQSGTQRSAFVSLQLPQSVGGITGVSAIPANQILNSGAPAALLLNWQLFTNPGETDAQSPRGIFRTLDGTTLLEIEQPLSGSGSNSFAMAESLSLSPGILNTWLRAGHTRVLYQRTFSDGGGNSRNAQISFTLLNSNNALSDTRSGLQRELQIQHSSLSFLEGERFARAALDDELFAKVRIAYGGSGLLSGIWQIADPIGSRQRQFSTLAVVNEFLPARQEMELRSPPLPTYREGRYLVRFCIVDARSGAGFCDSEQQLAQIGYSVGDRSGAIASIDALSPNGGAASAATSFQWREAPEASSYRMEIFADGGQFGLPRLGIASDAAPGRPVAGQLLKAFPGGTQPGTRLSARTRDALQAGGEYSWRIVALDESGEVIAQSRLAQFVYQP